MNNRNDIVDNPMEEPININAANTDSNQIPQVPAGQKHLSQHQSEVHFANKIIPN